MISSKDSVLIVVAHPDDEVLGMGGTGAILSKMGIKITSCILSGNADARRNRPSHEELLDDINKAQKILGFSEPILGDFPNIKFNTVSHLELVEFIEKAIAKTHANIIFTHHPGDLNDDHRQTSLSCQAACRLFQRKDDIPRLKSLYFFEVVSSTDWAFPFNFDNFRPDTYFEIGDALRIKIEALKAYRGVLREYPHSRSEENIRALATYRGAQAGLRYAEAFETAFNLLEIS